MTTIKLTPKQLLDRMRAVTAKLLGYDLEHLTPAQSVRLDRAASIRLMLDDVQGRLLAGFEIDIAKFCAASEALERMLGGDPDTQQQSVDQFAGAREELLHFLDARASALARRDERIAAEARQPPPVDTAPPVPSPMATVELMPANSVPPKQPHVSYIDAAVLEEQPHERFQRINGGHATPATRRPVSPLTHSYLGPGDWSDLGGNVWRTRDWSPRRGW